MICGWRQQQVSMLAVPATVGQAFHAVACCHDRSWQFYTRAHRRQEEDIREAGAVHAQEQVRALHHPHVVIQTAVEDREHQVHLVTLSALASHRCLAVVAR